ncbi:unnamed protein product [Danaus chrysippus]|uniref:(African queen) hypothetical protein n=1 Tax=Danaus chrysippus TaxID=151541 RepID=A0A8J2QX30_9NEOP|nr:unnamed protein product [Danaus chrysippus]
MTDKPGPSKRSSSRLTSCSRAKKKARKISTDSSLEDFVYSSEEAAFSQCCDEDDVSRGEEGSDNSDDSIFETRRRNRRDKLQPPECQKSSEQVHNLLLCDREERNKEKLTQEVSTDYQMDTSPSI